MKKKKAHRVLRHTFFLCPSRSGKMECPDNETIPKLPTCKTNCARKGIPLTCAIPIHPA